MDDKKTWGGAGRGGGRKSPDGIPRKVRSLRLSDQEYEAVKKYIDEMRGWSWNQQSKSTQ